MLSIRNLAAISLCLLIAGTLAMACFGGDGDDQPDDLSAVHTATPPNPLPTPLLLAQVSPPPAANTYTVQPSDSLSGIADQFGVSVDALMAANGITDPLALSVGQVLTIPTPDAVPSPAATEGPPVEGEATATPAPTTAPAGEGTYTVQDGDNASDIANSFGITVDELAAANGLTIDQLRNLSVGDVLTIPPPAAPQ
jgi:LysM repeat protein